MFQTPRGRVQEKPLRSKQLGGVREGSLREREGCSVTKRLGKPIGKTTWTRADQLLLNRGSVVHSRNVTWARLPPSAPVSTKKVRSVSVSKKEREIGSKSPWRGGS